MTRGCPLCGRPARPEARPFCSTRCADVDLGRWLTGGYAIPAEEAPDPDPQEPPSDPPGRG
ncbi:MAG: DNA gyrase inhibitor YacG [Gemmobacter sp.]